MVYDWSLALSNQYTGLGRLGTTVDWTVWPFAYKYLADSKVSGNLGAKCPAERSNTAKTGYTGNGAIAKVDRKASCHHHGSVDTQSHQGLIQPSCDNNYQY